MEKEPIIEEVLNYWIPLPFMTSTVPYLFFLPFEKRTTSQSNDHRWSILEILCAVCVRERESLFLSF